MRKYGPEKSSIDTRGSSGGSVCVPSTLGRDVAESGVATIDYVRERVGETNARLFSLNDRLARAVSALHEKLVGPQPCEATPADHEKHMAMVREQASRAPLVEGVGSLATSLAAFDAQLCRMESLL